MYETLDDQKFVNHIFTSEDRLDLKYVEEAKRRAKSVVPLLCEVLLQEKNYKRDGKVWWGVIHATHLLGILGDESALPALLAASRFSIIYDIEWIWEALPESYLRLGPAITPRLEEHIEGHRTEECEVISIEMDGLWNIWQAHPNRRQGIEDFFLKLLRSPGNTAAFNAHLIADFALIGRRDLKPLFVEMYDKGEVDLDVCTRQDMEHFFDNVNTPPGHRIDLEDFYRREEIEKRQRRWKEEEEREELRAFEEYLLEYHNRIGRNEKCPCGSGKKFKKCHLLWVEDELMRRRDEEASEAMLWENIGAVKAERRAETELRRLLASKGQTELFPLIQEKALAFVKAPNEEVHSKGFSGYFQGEFSLLDLEGKEETERFFRAFQEYINAVAHQHKGHPRGGDLT